MDQCGPAFGPDRDAKPGCGSLTARPKGGSVRHLPDQARARGVAWRKRGDVSPTPRSRPQTRGCLEGGGVPATLTSNPISAGKPAGSVSAETETQPSSGDKGHASGGPERRPPFAINSLRLGLGRTRIAQRLREPEGQPISRSTSASSTVEPSHRTTLLCVETAFLRSRASSKLRLSSSPYTFARNESSRAPFTD